MELKTWLLFSLVAMVLLSIANVAMKGLLNSFGKQTLDLGLLGQLNSTQMLLVAAILIFTALGAVSFVNAVNNGKPALVTAVVSLSTVLVAILSVFFLGDKFSTKEMVGMALAVISIVILAI